MTVKKTVFHVANRFGWPHALNVVLLAALVHIHWQQTATQNERPDLQNEILDLQNEQNIPPSTWSKTTNPTLASSGYNWTMWHNMRKSRVLEHDFAEFVKLPQAELFKNIFVNWVPMIIRGAAKALAKDAQEWDSAYLRKHWGSQTVVASYSPDKYFQRPKFGFLMGPKQQRMSFDAFLDDLEELQRQQRKHGSSTEYVSIQQSPLRGSSPTDDSKGYFKSAFNIDMALPFWDQLYPTFAIENLWVCSHGKVSRLHNDWRNNILVQAVGHKIITLIDPFRTHAVYPAKFKVNSWERKERGKFQLNTALARHRIVDNFPLVNLTHPDLDKYPLFKEANPLTIELHPGDMLILPAYWFHQVESNGRKSDGLNIAFNYWFRCNAFVSRAWKSLGNNLFRDCVGNACDDI